MPRAEPPTPLELPKSPCAQQRMRETATHSHTPVPRYVLRPAPAPRCMHGLVLCICVLIPIQKVLLLLLVPCPFNVQPRTYLLASSRPDTARPRPAQGGSSSAATASPPRPASDIGRAGREVRRRDWSGAKDPQRTTGSWRDSDSRPCAAASDHDAPIVPPARVCYLSRRWACAYGDYHWHLRYRDVPRAQVPECAPGTRDGARRGCLRAGGPLSRTRMSSRAEGRPASR